MLSSRHWTHWPFQHSLPLALPLQSDDVAHGWQALATQWPASAGHCSLEAQVCAHRPWTQVVATPPPHWLLVLHWTHAGELALPTGTAEQ